MTTEIKHYLEVKALMNRLDAIGNRYSLEWRMKDAIKDMLRDGFSKEDIQLIFTIVMNEQYDVAEDELSIEVARERDVKTELTE